MKREGGFRRKKVGVRKIKLFDAFQKTRFFGLKLRRFFFSPPSLVFFSPSFMAVRPTTSCDLCTVTTDDSTVVLLKNKRKERCPGCNREAWHESCIDRTIARDRGVRCTGCNKVFSANRIGVIARTLNVFLYDTPLWPWRFMRAVKLKNEPSSMRIPLLITKVLLYLFYVMLICVTIGSWIEGMLTTWRNISILEDDTTLFTKVMFIPVGSLVIQRELYNSVVRSNAMSNIARATRISMWILMANTTFKFLYLFCVVHMHGGKLLRYIKNEYFTSMRHKKTDAEIPTPMQIVLEDSRVFLFVAAE